MSEVEQVCDRVGVIDRGVLVKEGSVDELRGDAVLLVRAEPLEHAGRVVEGLPGVAAVARGDGTLRVTADPAAAAAIVRALVGAGVAVTELRPERASLEDVFLNLTREDEERTA